MTDKTEAARLADALEKAFPAYGDGTRSDRERLAIDAAAPIRNWDATLRAAARRTAEIVHPGKMVPPDQSERIADLEKRLQHYIGTAARRSIEISLIESLLDDKDYETTSTDMEYWGPTHDKVRAMQERIAALAQTLEQARKALAELVDLKDTEARLQQLHEMGYGTDCDNYYRRKLAAWDAARVALRKIEEVQR